MNYNISSDELCLKIWELTRRQLSARQPFFRSLLFKFLFKPSAETKTYGTDGKVIYYCPDFIITKFKSDNSALENMLLHALYHCMFLHPILEPDKNPELWNCACDISVDRLINLDTKTCIPAVICDELADDISKLHEIRDSKFSDDHHFWKNCSRKDFLDSIRCAWQSANSSGFGIYGSGGIGTSPGNISEDMLLINKHKYDFRKFLKRFANTREEIIPDTTDFDYIPYIYGLKNYHNIPLIEHLESSEVNRIEELVIAIDTSGSCSRETVQTFMEETYGILSNRESFFKKMNIFVIQCDSFIQDVVHVTNENGWHNYIKNLRIHGRGGTDFRPVFDYVQKLKNSGELKRLKGLLYFTDGDGIYPQKPTDYQTAFVFYHEKALHQKVPEWIIKLYMDDKKGNQPDEY